MANILDKYGIKEVADVTLYEIAADGTATTPVLFLDTLKVSTIEQTAEQTEARGGKGNPPLIIWDYGKEIIINLEDALFTPRSMQVMYGSAETTLAAATAVITKMKYVSNVSAYLAELSTKTDKPTSKKYFTVSAMQSIAEATATGMTTPAYVEETYNNISAYTIEISANNFPGTYKLVGDTYARNQSGGGDEFFQFIVYQAKMGAENTITLEAEGEPAVFSMTMRVLRPADGVMMKLVKYNLT